MVVNLKKIEMYLSKILLVGVIASSLFIIFAIFLSYDKNINLNTAYNYKLDNILVDIISLEPVAYYLLGVFLLILIPIIRILTMLVQFIYQKNLKYIIISLLVIVILCVSLSLGITH